MNSFKPQLKRKFYDSLYNNFGIENHDEGRYGIYKKEKANHFDGFKRFIKKKIGFKNDYTEKYFEERYNYIIQFEDSISQIWEAFSTQDKNIFLELITFKFLGNKRVKLSTNNKEYYKSIKEAESLKDDKDFIVSNFNDIKLYKHDLSAIGKNVKLYFSSGGIAIDFIREQYAYKVNDVPVVQVEKGDTVFDFGGCWGDTALYFGDKTGNDGKVYCFEFIPGNIEYLKKNLELNPHLDDVIDLVEHPVFDKSDIKCYYKDNGPGSIVKMQPFDGNTGETTTLSLDDFVERNNITKVDFIKMDIEGAEPFALEGAIKTIKKFKPKLAIANYHGMSDFVNIPKWILDLNLGYEIFLGHYTIHWEESVCFAKIKEI